MEITSKVMLVTPEMATKWLANTIGNRHINKERVKTYVNDIKKGWALNGQPIIISDKNHLMDGHHRLTAIIEAKTPARFVVTYGVKEETMATIDIGMRRSNSNVFAIAGIKNYAPISSIVNRFFTMNQTDGVFMNHGTTKEPPQNLLDEYYRNPEFYQLASHVGGRCEETRIFTITFAGTIFAWLVQTGGWDAEKVENFLMCASHFEDMSIPQAVVLRTVIQKKINANKSVGLRIDYSYLSSLCALAFNNYVTNRNPRSLTFDVAQGWVKFLKNNSLPLNI